MRTSPSTGQGPAFAAPTITTGRVDGSAPVFVGQNSAHLAALRSIESLAAYEHATVLIEGESGTGKSYAARLLHHASPRARGPFHQVILSALDDNIAASDLFGHLS